MSWLRYAKLGYWHGYEYYYFTRKLKGKQELVILIQMGIQLESTGDGVLKDSAPYFLFS